MPDLSPADIAALRDLLGGIHPDLLPLAVDQARSDFWTRYSVADANGLEFATVRNDDDVTASLIVRAVNALPALLDAAEKVAELEAQLAAIKAADPDLFDPTGGTNRGAAYETYGSAGEELREAYLAAIGVDLNAIDNEETGR